MSQSAPSRIYLRHGVVVFEDGSQAKITNMLDVANEETDDPEQATRIVAGPLRNGKWFACVVTSDDLETVH